MYWHDEVFTSLRASGYVEEEILEQAFSGLPIAPSHLLQYQKLTPDRGWRETWHALTTHPEHPPLYYLLSRLSMEWWGSTPTVTRSLSVIFQQFQIQNLTVLKPLQQLGFMILNISTDR